MSERPQSTGSKIMFSLFFLLFYLYDRVCLKTKTKRSEIDFFEQSRKF
jgi:hypothetical protein